MKKYKGSSRNSDVIAYESGPDWIKVKFKDDTVFTYSYKSAGRIHVETMKDLAQSGKYLSTYIHRYMKGQQV